MQYSWEVGFKGKKFDILKVCEEFNKHKGFKEFFKLDENGRIELKDKKAINFKVLGVSGSAFNITPDFDELPDDTITQLTFSSDDSGIRIPKGDILYFINIAPDLEVGFSMDSDGMPDYLYSKKGTTKIIRPQYGSKTCELVEKLLNIAK